MLTKLSLLAVAVLMLVSCQSNEALVEESDVVSLTLAEFNANPKDYVGKVLAVRGTVDHVCRHGGKKMFIMGDNPEQRLRIETTDDVGPFAIELEGSDVAVEGIVRVLKIDDAYLDNWEAEARVEHGEEPEGIPCDGESLVAEADVAGDEPESELAGTLAQISDLRQELAASGEEYLGFYHLECKSYDELEH